MKRSLIFAIILLATLSMINAIPHQLHKRVTTFVPCPEGSLNVISVQLQPDPPVSDSTLTIMITGTLTSGNIAPGSLLNVGAVDNAGTLIGTAGTLDICTAIACPVTTGQSFVLMAAFPTKTLPEPYNL